jgi:hypothetical protein
VWSTTPAHAFELEKMSPSEFGAAVTHALHAPADAATPVLPPVPEVPEFIKAAAPVAALERLKIKVPEFLRNADPTKILGAGKGMFGSCSPAEEPPVVTGWEGHAPKSFPLSVQHAGRCVAACFLYTFQSAPQHKDARLLVSAKVPAA